MNSSEKIDILFIYWECEKNSRHAIHVYAVCFQVYVY
jgi:hypothetical protein